LEQALRRLVGFATLARAAGRLQKAVEKAKVDAFSRRLCTGVTVALTALAVLTGCGGNSSSSSTVSAGALSSSSMSGSASTPETNGTTLATSAATTDVALHCDPEPCQLTRAELAAKLDALCLRGNAAVERADISFEQARKASDYAGAGAAMESALLEFPPYQLAIQGLAPPAQDRAALTHFEDVTRRIHGLSERIVAAARARHTADTIRLTRLVQEDLAARARAAVDLGTNHCGR
jgi:hypothetical protein